MQNVTRTPAGRQFVRLSGYPLVLRIRMYVCGRRKHCDALPSPDVRAEVRGSSSLAAAGGRATNRSIAEARTCFRNVKRDERGGRRAIVVRRLDESHGVYTYERDPIRSDLR